MATAARAGAPPICGYCSGPCVAEEDDLVDIQCKLTSCVDGKCTVYHRSCMLARS
jgi:hypothetical protein